MPELEDDRRRPKVLVAGRGEPGLAALCDCLDSRGVDVCVVEGGLDRAVLAERPNLVLLVGDAASDDGASGIDEVRRVSSTPVVVTTDPEPLDRRLSPFQYGAVGILVRRGAAEEMAGELSHLLAENARMAAQKDRRGSGAFDALVGLGSAELRGSPTPSEGARPVVVPRPVAIVPEDPDDVPTRELPLVVPVVAPSLESPHDTQTVVAVALPDWDEDLTTKRTPQHELARWRRLAAQDRAILPTPRQMPGISPPSGAKRTPRSRPGLAAAANVATVGGLGDPLPAVLSEPPPHEPGNDDDGGEVLTRSAEGPATRRAPSEDELRSDPPSDEEPHGAPDASRPAVAPPPDEERTDEPVSGERDLREAIDEADAQSAPAADAAEPSVPPGQISLEGLAIPEELTAAEDLAWGAGTTKESAPGALRSGASRAPAASRAPLPAVGMTDGRVEERGSGGRKIKSFPPPSPPMPRKGISPFTPGTGEHESPARTGAHGVLSADASGLATLTTPSSPSMPAYVDRASTLRAQAVQRPRASVLPSTVMLGALLFGTAVVIAPYARDRWSEFSAPAPLTEPIARPAATAPAAPHAGRSTEPTEGPAAASAPPADTQAPAALLAPPEADTAQPQAAAEPTPAPEGVEPVDARQASDELIRRAIELERGGDLDGAHAALRRAVETDPVNPHALIALAEERLAAGDAAEATRLAERAVQLRRRRAAYHIVLGDAYRLSGERRRATREWEAALELEPESSEAQRRLAPR